jgi:hypothetical protein
MQDVGAPAAMHKGCKVRPTAVVLRVMLALRVAAVILLLTMLHGDNEVALLAMHTLGRPFTCMYGAQTAC